MKPPGRGEFPTTAALCQGVGWELRRNREGGVRHPDLFVGVIPMAGGYIPEIDLPPAASVGDPRYYFMVGALDRAVDEVRRAAGDFKVAGYEVKLRVLPGTGHTFPRATRQELSKALRFVLDR